MAGVGSSAIHVAWYTWSQTDRVPPVPIARLTVSNTKVIHMVLRMEARDSRMSARG